MLVRPGGDRIGFDVYLDTGWHDMRCIGNDLKTVLAPRYVWQWEARFSRAVRTLEARGVIVFPAIFDLRDTPRAKKLCRTDDGVWLDRHWLGNSRQRWFGRLSSIFPNKHTAYEVAEREELESLVRRLGGKHVDKVSYFATF